MSKVSLYVVKNNVGQYVKWTHPLGEFDGWTDTYDPQTCKTHNKQALMELARKYSDLEIQVEEKNATDVEL